MNNMLVSQCCVLLCILSVASSERRTGFRTCRNTAERLEGQLTWIDMGGCREVPCPLISGTNFTTEMEFTADRVFHNATVEVIGHLTSTLAVPFAPMGTRHGCDYMNCGEAAGETITFSKWFYVDPWYPKIPLIVEMRIYTDVYDYDKDAHEQHLLVCFTIPLRINNAT